MTDALLMVDYHLIATSAQSEDGEKYDFDKRNITQYRIEKRQRLLFFRLLNSWFDSYFRYCLLNFMITVATCFAEAHGNCSFFFFNLLFMAKKNTKLTVVLSNNFR